MSGDAYVMSCLRSRRVPSGSSPVPQILPLCVSFAKLRHTLAYTVQDLLTRFRNSLRNTEDKIVVQLGEEGLVRGLNVLISGNIRQIHE